MLPDSNSPVPAFLGSQAYRLRDFWGRGEPCKLRLVSRIVGPSFERFSQEGSSLFSAPRTFVFFEVSEVRSAAFFRATNSSLNMAEG